MSSFGSGGGSATGSTGGAFNARGDIISGLGLDKLYGQVMQGMQSVQGPAATPQPGRIMSPQERFMMSMQQMGGMGG